MIFLIIVFPVLIFILFWKFLSVDVVLKPKKFYPRQGSNSRYLKTLKVMAAHPSRH